MTTPEQPARDPAIESDPDRGPSRTAADREPNSLQQGNDDESTKVERRAGRDDAPAREPKSS